uniref:Zinc finger and BTB domain containing 48 n=1 Tax=Takifugu rubripes TaxID=31033 RepID=A0A3B5JWI1_TAKRU
MTATFQINNTQYVHFLEQADALRRSGMMCDAVISVRNQIFRAHRLVLACASRRLAEKLALGGNEGPVRCTLESFSPRTFKQVLDFTYKQALEVTLDDLQLLLRAAEVLEIQPLEEQCRTQLEIIHCKNGEVDRTREGSGKISEQKLREGPVQDEKLGPSVGEESDSIVIEDNSPVDPVKTPDSPQPPMKKARTPSSSVTQFDRVSVISRHAGSSARVADYTGFIPFHPVQHHDQSAVYRNSVLPVGSEPSTSSGSETDTNADEMITNAIDTFQTFSCQFCEKIFSASSTLKKHESLHQGDTPYSCMECGEGFKKRRHLIGHKIIHERRMQCTVCKMTVLSVKELIQHRKSHLQKGMLQCPDCDQQFQYPVYLLRHLESHRKRENRLSQAQEKIKIKPQLIESEKPPAKEEEVGEQLQCSLCKEVYVDISGKLQ